MRSQESGVRSQKSEAVSHGYSDSCLLTPVSSALRAFVLLEAMVAVAIFAIGVLTLGKCVSSCLAAEHFKQEDGLARRALENRMAEIEAGAVIAPVVAGAGGISSGGSTEDLKPPFEGMKMKQRAVPVKKKNEDEKEITGISAVTLEVSWQSGGETQTKELMFYVYPRQR